MSQDVTMSLQHLHDELGEAITNADWEDAIEICNSISQTARIFNREKKTRSILTKERLGELIDEVYDDTNLIFENAKDARAYNDALHDFKDRLLKEIK